MTKRKPKFTATDRRIQANAKQCLEALKKAPVETPFEAVCGCLIAACAIARFCQVPETELHYLLDQVRHGNKNPARLQPSGENQ
jgi:hypothetical protein